MVGAIPCGRPVLHLPEYVRTNRKANPCVHGRGDGLSSPSYLVVALSIYLFSPGPHVIAELLPKIPAQRIHQNTRPKPNNIRNRQPRLILSLLYSRACLLLAEMLRHQC
jgi:hypothetical protein